MAEGDTEAWGFLRAVRAYRAAFEDCAEAPAFEAAPFPVRIQAEADLAARDPWRILAWENPFAKGGPASPFWAEEPMLEGEGSPTAPPLVALLADAGARLDGLRLLDGTLIVKVEQDGRAVQIRVANDGPLLAGGASGSTTITGWSCRWISPGSRIYGASRAGRPLGKGGVGGRGTGTSDGAGGQPGKGVAARDRDRLLGPRRGRVEMGPQWLDARTGPLQAEGGAQGREEASGRRLTEDAAPDRAGNEGAHGSHRDSGCRGVRRWRMRPSPATPAALAAESRQGSHPVEAADSGSNRDVALPLGLLGFAREACDGTQPLRYTGRRWRLPSCP